MPDPIDQAIAYLKKRCELHERAAEIAMVDNCTEYAAEERATAAHLAEAVRVLVKGGGAVMKFAGFDITCKVCGETPRVMFEPECPGYSEYTPGSPASFEIACQKCGSSFDLDDGYRRRDKFPSARTGEVL